MKLQGPVLVGTDFTAASDEALRQGNDLANDFGTSLIVCHVVPELDTINVLFPQLAAGNAERRQILTDKAMAAVERRQDAGW
jgi:nucleotide-binding universal stress UspA family protein